ncbi:MAG: adenylosuccinate lyase [Bacillota bacterium]
MEDTSRYESPLSSRYASKEMLALFSADHRYRTWRKLWVALAETERELGLDISEEQIGELKAHIDDIDYAAIAEKEHQIRHDVMAHVYGYGLCAPKAAGIIHLGATSCYVTDNADIIIYRDALGLLRAKLLLLADKLARFSYEHRALPTLGYTHFQPAQLVTVGKRATLWLQDFLSDLDELDYLVGGMMLLGSKGTTGTQASFLSLFEGDHDKVRAADERIAQKMGFAATYPVTGQTYPRKLDSRILNVLSAVAQSAYRFANDMRLLQHMREIEEPFEKDQVGSSAMAYKRNPMRSERICSLSRYIMVDALNAPLTASMQWLERTLDDSANRRISLPEGFLAADAVLKLCISVSDGLVVYPKVIERNVMEYLPFIATENLLMAAVKKGGNRQELHEVIRVHSMAASYRMKHEDGVCDLLERLRSEPKLGLAPEEFDAVLDPSTYIGRCTEQVEEYLERFVTPLLEGAVDYSIKADINV